MQALTIGIGLLLLTTVIVNAQECPMFKHDPQHLGLTDSDALSTNEISWKFEEDQGWSLHTIINGRVYAGEDGDSYFFSLKARGSYLGKGITYLVIAGILLLTWILLRYKT